MRFSLNSPLAQAGLALANGIASAACFKASKKPLYRVAGGMLASFTIYHVVKAVKGYRQGGKR